MSYWEVGHSFDAEDDVAAAKVVKVVAASDEMPFCMIVSLTVMYVTAQSKRNTLQYKTLLRKFEYYSSKF